jgi:hypothetical protein
MGEQEDKNKHDERLIKAFELGIEDLTNGGHGNPWDHPSFKPETKPKTPEMI